MVTRGDEVLAAFAAALAALDELRLEHYEDSAVRSIVERLGSRLERFFKTAVFPDAAASDTFDTLINRLKSLGIAKTVRGQLHSVRDLYNDAKHDPAASVRLKRAVDAISAARGGVETLIANGIGATAAPIEKVISRLLWVSAYDVYVGGVTEVYVSLPLPEDIFATHLDLVWIDGLAWDSMKAELLATGCFHYGKEHFDPEVYARFGQEQDFLNAGVWDGDYRQLIQIISKYEDRPTAGRLIPNLRRDHMSIAVHSAIALAGVDVATAATAPLGLDELRAAILKRADEVYAMPDERSWVQATAAGLAELIVQLPFAAWSQLNGPFWNLWNPKPFTAAVSPADAKKIRYVIDDASRVVIV
ncbi:hypothetical protein GCM10010923_03600 [Blastomonas marina]|uniref:Uncharacterized protein n=1 Tax=Blastomonas marina TaxID=1867408 RepID=A0ABQ1F3A2_9SPHN|nr:hypothetical protein [Blastomonas marina]GFZ98669.1 hypothetical protein GCM10010923_03600 [Blastomonas marina]